MNKVNKALLWGSITLLVLVAVFYLVPIYFQGIRILPLRRLNLSEARNYYSILSSFITLLGLLLGYVYYTHKLTTDKINADQERKRKRLDFLIVEINKYDDLVDEIICFHFSDSIQLMKIRQKILKNSESIESMLSLKERLFGFTDEEAMTILRVHSFVEKNDILMRSSFEDLDKEKLLSIRSQYIDLIREARRICLEKIC